MPILLFAYLNGICVSLTFTDSVSCIQAFQKHSSVSHKKAALNET